MVIDAVLKLSSLRLESPGHTKISEGISVVDELIIAL